MSFIRLIVLYGTGVLMIFVTVTCRHLFTDSPPNVIATSSDTTTMDSGNVLDLHWPRIFMCSSLMSRDLFLLSSIASLPSGKKFIPVQ